MYDQDIRGIGAYKSFCLNWLILAKLIFFKQFHTHPKTSALGRPRETNRLVATEEKRRESVEIYSSVSLTRGCSQKSPALPENSSTPRLTSDLLKVFAVVSFSAVVFVILLLVVQVLGNDFVHQVARPHLAINS